MLAPLMVPLGIESEAVAGDANAIALMGKGLRMFARHGLPRIDRDARDIGFRISDSGALKMKKWLGIFLVGGLLSLVGVVNTLRAQEGAPKDEATAATTEPAPPAVALPPYITGTSPDPNAPLWPDTTGANAGIWATPAATPVKKSRWPGRYCR